MNVNMDDMDVPRVQLPTKNQVVRALVVKQLWERAVLDARSHNEASWIGGAMTAGVALETALKGAMSSSGSPGKDQGLKELIDAFSEAHPPGVDPQHVQAGHELRLIRNAIQHGGAIPARRSVVHVVTDVEPLLARAVATAFDVDLRSLNYVELLDDPVFRPALARAHESVDRSDLAVALALAAACYEQMRFRLSSEGVAVRAAGKEHFLRSTLASRIALLSQEMLTPAVGIDSAHLVVTEVDLADRANVAFAHTSLGMSAMWLAEMERALHVMTQHRKNLPAALEMDGLKECTPEIVRGILDFLARHAWMLEETQPELFGIQWTGPG